ncbi:MAG TPA: hypothetical protein VHP11_03175 [Tepidisphaeraceae bacterium]|nr:hypothetical protein [Tepidisphaeraceae bacterium]
MARLRVTGLVRTADELRRDLAHAMAPGKRDRWRATVIAMLAKIDEQLAIEQAGIKDLPAPSQRAYHFLSTLDWGKVVTTVEGPAQATDAPAQVTFGGLSSFLNRAVTRLTTADTAGKVEQVRASIATISRRLEFAIARSSTRPEQLSETTRGVRGWLAFFGEQANLDLYIQALKVAGGLAAAVTGQGYRGSVAIQFRPTPYLYKIQQGRAAATLILPAPMVAFEATEFQLVGDLIGRRSRQAKQRLHQAMLSDGYQAIQAEMEVLGGIPEQSRGAYYDLAAVFDRINERYFRGKLARPKLIWSRIFTGRKFGHYDSIRDTVMVSSTLDQSGVPDYVVDYLVYHELLHKHLGVRVVGGRRYSHTGEFRLWERRFERFREAEAELERLAK